MKYLLFICFLAACDNRKVLETLDSTTKSFQPMKQQAQEEIEKAYQVEYLVKEFDSNILSTELTESLNILGKERWDCSPIVTTNLKLICKRKPKSVLNYVPRIF